MGNEQRMSIDADVLSAAVRELTEAVTIINTKSNQFLQLVQETNQQTQNRFALTMELVPVLEEQRNKIQTTIKTVGEIEEAVKRYMALAEEAADTDFLKMQ